SMEGRWRCGLSSTTPRCLLYDAFQAEISCRPGSRGYSKCSRPPPIWCSLHTDTWGLRGLRPRGKTRSQLQLLFPLPKRPQAQRVEANETCGIALVVGDGALLERDQVLVVERVATLPTNHADPALVQLEPDAAGHVGLRLVDGSLQHLPLRREPEPVIDQFSI